MIRFAIYAMVYLGSALMVYNIYGFIRFSRFVRGLKNWGQNNAILFIPIVLLVLFLAGYLAVGIFGHPDLIVSAILFGGSIFVFVMYLMLKGITARILTGEQMETKLRAAEESNRVKNSFLANMSHEMRTPMNVILGLDEIALKNPALPPETRDQLEKIGHSGRHLLGLINNLLEMNVIESGAQEFRNEEFSMTEVLEQLNVMAQSMCEVKGLTYSPAELKGYCGRTYGDSLKLKRILLSLLDNAAKFTDAPGTVTFRAERIPDDVDKQTLRFTVADTGVGIDREFLLKIFQPFSKEDAGSTARVGGGGLSLAVAKRTAEAVGGSIEVQSEKGKGSVFTLIIPFSCENCTHKTPDEIERVAEPAEEVSLEGRRVLIVEDVPENAEIAADLLELEGAETEHAENGRIAVDMVKASAPGYYDAILMDLRMPVMDGLEATRQIRALDRPDVKTVPIVALTANAFESDVRQTADAGMNAHLAKPADADELYGTLKRLIRNTSDDKDTDDKNKEGRDA